jgi:hypothetical protein
MKQTAVEWLQQEVILQTNLPFNLENVLVFNKLIQQAIQIEKQQIEDVCVSMYSKEEVLEQLNILMSLPSSTLDKFTDDNGNITIKWFEQFKKK